MEFSVGEPSSTGLEALSVLRAAAERPAGPLAHQLAERALRITERDDFAVAQEALEALLRRLAAARESRDIVSRPAHRAPGWYRVGSRSAATPSHDLLVTSLDPIEASCSCSDYASASLGLCQHIFLAVSGRTGRARAVAPPPLRWDPVRPLTGEGDWLERVRWHEPPSPSQRDGRVRRLFRPGDGDGMSLPPRAIADPRERLATIEALLEFARASERGAEPAILPQLERDRRRLAEMVRHGLTPREVRRHCEGLKRRLFLYQREGVRRFVERGRMLLADDLGLGKTAQAIAACHVLVASGRVRRGVVAVPAARKPHWAREWQRFTDLPLVSVEARPDERMRRGQRDGAVILLVDHEQLRRDASQLCRFRPDLVVVDEILRIGNSATSTASLLGGLDPPWRLVLTATPLEERFDDLLAMMQWVDESALEPRWRLAAWHSFGDGRNAFGRARNLETVRQRIAPSWVRRERRDVVEQLPRQRDIRISVPLSPAQLAAHDDLARPIARLVARGARRPLGQPELVQLMDLLRRQRIICNGMAQREFRELWPSIERRRPSAPLLDSLSSPKLGELRQLVAGIAVTQERKVVVFSQWRRMLRLAAWAVSDLLRAAGVRAVFLDGDDGARRRTQKVASFLDDAAVRVLFATDEIGLGPDLRRAASCCIHLDVPWDPAVVKQRAACVHGVGQVHPVEMYALVAEAGLEDRIAALHGDRRAPLSGLFDGNGDGVALEQAAPFLSCLQTMFTGAVAVDGDPGLLDPALAGPDHDMSSEADTDDVPASAPAAGSLASLLAQVEVRNLPDGRVAFEAPAPAAAALAEVFQAVARLLAAGEPIAAENLSS